MYDPTLGQFISRDPIEYEGGINLYEYVGDSPLNRTDPSGLWGPAPQSPDNHNYINVLTHWLSVFQIRNQSYLFFECSGLGNLISMMWEVLKNHVRHVYANQGGVNEYGKWSNDIYYSTPIARTDDAWLIHEIIHAIDDSKDWNINRWSDYTAVEHLAYAVQHLISSMDSLRRFEDDLKSGSLKDCDAIRDRWNGVWTNNFAALGNTPVFVAGVSGSSQDGDVTNEDLMEVWRKFSFGFSCECIRKAYQALVNEKAGCDCELKCPSDLPGALK